MKVFYAGMLEEDPRSSSFWTLDDLSLLARTPSAQAVLEARLLLGLDFMLPSHALLRWSINTDSLSVPTEADGFRHKYFVPTDLRTNPKHGTTLDLRDLHCLRVTAREVVGKGIPVDQLDFVSLRFSEADISDAKRTYYADAQSLLVPGLYITDPAQAAGSLLAMMQSGRL